MAAGYLPIAVPGNALQAPSVPRVPVSAIANPLGALAEGIAKGSEILARDLEESQGLEAAKDLAALKGRWQKELVQRQHDAPAGAPGFSESLARDFTADVEGLRSKYGGRARDYFDLHAASFGASLNTDAFAYEAKARTDKTVRDVGDILDANRNAVRSNPRLHDTTFEEGRQLIENSTLPAQAKSKLTDTWRGQIAQSAVEGLVDADPHAARKVLTAGGWDDKLSPEAKSKALALADREIKEREREARARAAEARADARFQYGAALDDAAKVNSAGGQVDVDAIVKAGKAAGLKPEAIERTRQNLTAANRGAVIFSDYAVSEKSFAEIDKEVRAKIEAVRNAGTDPDKPNATALAIEAEAAQRAQARLIEAYGKDPVGFMRSTSKNIDQAFRDAEGAADPEKSQAAWSRALALTRDRHAVLFADPRVRKGAIADLPLLDKRTASVLAARLAEDPAGLDKLRLAMGDANFNAAWPDLVKAGLPPGARIQAQIDPSNPEGARMKQLATTAFNPQVAAENAKRLTGDDKKSLEEEVAAQFAQFRRTVPNAGLSPKTQQELNLQEAGLRTLAAHLYLSGEAGSIPDAARMAYSHSIANNYDWIFSGTARARRGAGSDAEAFLLRETQAIVKERNFKVPGPGEPGWSDIAKLDADYVRNLIALDLERNGRWRNTKDDSGWELVDGAGLPVLDPQGRKILRRYGDVPQGFSAMQRELRIKNPEGIGTERERERRRQDRGGAFGPLQPGQTPTGEPR